MDVNEEAVMHIETIYKRSPSKLDKYIDLILKNVKNVDEFIYLTKTDENDPYNLKVVNYKDIRGEK